MTIVFRINYRTVFGQSLAVKIRATELASGSVLEFELPLSWKDEFHWENRWDTGGPLRLEYSYIMRDDRNGMELEEWHAPRIRELAETGRSVKILADDWCSAGTPDYAYETAAFLQRPDPPDAPPVSGDANHIFQLRMALVPSGAVPCILGSTNELGDWQYDCSIPLVETGRNLWTAALHLPADVSIEYKYGLRCAASGHVLELEGGRNRALPPERGDAVVHASDEAYQYHAHSLFRGAGVAVPVFSLRSETSLGTGEFADLRGFGDWAASCGLKLIQILPVNDTTSAGDWMDSYPYSAISVFALHPLYLRIAECGFPLDEEISDGLEAARNELNALPEIAYQEVMDVKIRLARAVFMRHSAEILTDPAFRAFVEENRGWLIPYAAFCVLRDTHGMADFSRWGRWARYDPLKAEEIVTAEGNFELWLQFVLDRQLRDAVSHLREIGIRLKGDLPIGIDRHSADAWSQPHLFHMDFQAGAPPDAFAVKGQNWGFPTYNWQEMAKDGYAWWRQRLSHLARYFDAFRIDHILGFFRIWQIPQNQIEGIMGWFDPAAPVTLAEFSARGIPFDCARFCEPFIHAEHLAARFGEFAETAAREFFTSDDGWHFRLKEMFSDQRKISEHFSCTPEMTEEAFRECEILRDGLMDCVSDVLFFEVPGSAGTLFHPRHGMDSTFSFLALDEETRRKLRDLHDDYFYRRQEGLWQAQGFQKLPALRRASRMLLCGEDLGMVPECVPPTLKELGFLSLEIQRMPKTPHAAFSDPRDAPYLSVVSPGTHDMATLRGWWQEEPEAAAQYAREALGIPSPPAELGPELAAAMIARTLESPAMWSIFPIQDLLAMDETLAHPDIRAERINIPAIIPHNWRYRMHLMISELERCSAFHERLHTMVASAGR